MNVQANSLQAFQRTVAIALTILGGLHVPSLVTIAWLRDNDVTLVAATAILLDTGRPDADADGVSGSAAS